MQKKNIILVNKSICGTYCKINKKQQLRINTTFFEFDEKNNIYDENDLIEEEIDSFDYYQKIYSGFSKMKIENENFVNNQNILQEALSNQKLQEKYQLFFHSCSMGDLLKDIKKILSKFLELDVYFIDYIQKKENVLDEKINLVNNVEQQKKYDQDVTISIDENIKLNNCDKQNDNNYSKENVRDIKKKFKENMFNTIHELSNKRETPFISINSRIEFLKNISSYTFLNMRTECQTQIVETHVKENSDNLIKDSFNKNNSTNTNNTNNTHTENQNYNIYENSVPSLISVPLKKCIINNQKKTKANIKFPSFSENTFFTPPGTVIFNKHFFVQEKSINIMMKIQIHQTGLFLIDCYKIIRADLQDEKEKQKTEKNDIRDVERDKDDKKSVPNKKRQVACSTNNSAKNKYNNNNNNNNNNNTNKFHSTSNNDTTEIRENSLCSFFLDHNEGRNVISPIFITIEENPSFIKTTNHFKQSDKNKKFYILGNSIKKRHLDFKTTSFLMKTKNQKLTENEKKKLIDDNFLQQIQKKNLIILKFSSNDQQSKDYLENLLYIFFFESIALIEYDSKKRKFTMQTIHINEKKEQSRKLLIKLKKILLYESNPFINKNDLSNNNNNDNSSTSKKELQQQHNNPSENIKRRKLLPNDSNKRNDTIVERFSKNDEIKKFFIQLDKPSRNLNQSSEKISFYYSLINLLINKMNIEKSKLKNHIFT